MNTLRDWRPFLMMNQTLLLLKTLTQTSRWPGTVVQQRPEDIAKQKHLRSLRQFLQTKVFPLRPMPQVLSPVPIPRQSRRGKWEK